MKRMALAMQNTPGDMPRTDRFVMSRNCLEELRMRRGLDDEAPIEIWNTNLRKKRYKNFLHEAFGLKPEVSRHSEDLVAPWPCVPRRKPFLAVDSGSFEISTYSWARYPELIDWSSKDCLVAALGKTYHVVGSYQVRAMGSTTHTMQCCKFDPRGELLLLGTRKRTAEIHTNNWTFTIKVDGCGGCSDGVNCSITAVDWSPKGDSFVTGCSRGVVTTFDREANLISTWNSNIRIPVLYVRVSPDTRLVAIMRVRSHSVYILVWPSLNILAYFCSCLTVKSMAWHPWRPALLAVASANSDWRRINLWDARSTREQQKTCSQHNYDLDLILFSRATGELVMSFCDPEVNTSQLTVMKDFSTPVDQSPEPKHIFGVHRIRTMVFNPDGTTLATATEGDDLVVWNFLPEDKKREEMARHRNFSALPVHADLATGFPGFVMR